MSDNPEAALIPAAITAVTGTIAAVIAYFGGRNSKIHEINNSITAGFERLEKSRIASSEWDRRRTLMLERRVTQCEIHIAKLEHVLHEAGLPIPLMDPLVEAELVPASGAR